MLRNRYRTLPHTHMEYIVIVMMSNLGDVLTLLHNTQGYINDHFQ